MGEVREDHLRQLESLSEQTTVPVQALVDAAIDEFLRRQEQRTWPAYVRGVAPAKRERG